MKLSDRTTGLMLVALGILAAFGASQLPPMPGQPIGPSVFPSLIGFGLVLCGALVALGIGQGFEEPDPEDLVAFQRTTGPLFGLRALLPVGVLLFYVLAADTLGFVPVAALMVFVVATFLGASVRQAVLPALIAPLLIHIVFAKLLRVPLPAGLLPMPW